jgi:uncharacterized protein (DUF433 family)
MTGLHSDIVIRDPEVLGGTPVFKGTRVPFQSLLDYLEGGQTLDEFLADFPSVTREAAVRALELHDTLKLGRTERCAFVEGLLNPPAPNPALQRAVQRHRRLRVF